MSNLSKKNHAFRPTLGDQHLEERVVMSGVSAAHLAASHAHAFPSNGGGNASNGLTLSQLRQGYGQQFRSAFTDLKNFLHSQAMTLYQNGRPSTQQLLNFDASVNGALNASAFRLSSQYSLLPGQTGRLLSSLQNSLLGNGPGTLSTRIGNLPLTGRGTGSESSLMNVINRQINATSALGANQLSRFFNTTNFARMSVDQNGNRIPLQQFVGNQLVNQFGNTFGSLSNTFANLGSSLYANGATPTMSQLSNFQTQTTQALGTAAFQLGSNLQLFKNMASTLAPQIQSALYATGTNPTTGMPNNSLFTGLQGVFNSTGNNTPSTFTTAAQNAFGNNFGNVVSPIYKAFGLQTPILASSGLPNFTMPTGTNPGVFGSQFTSNNFNGGFNNGFGSGFPGFGQPPTSGFNNSFSSAFGNFVNNSNTNFGLSTPITAGTGQQFFPLGGGNGLGGSNIGGNTTNGASNGLGGSNIGGNTTNGASNGLGGSNIGGNTTNGASNGFGGSNIGGNTTTTTNSGL